MRIYTPCYRSLAFRSKSQAEDAKLKADVFPAGEAFIMGILDRVDEMSANVWDEERVRLAAPPRPPPLTRGPNDRWRPCSYRRGDPESAEEMDHVYVNDERRDLRRAPDAEEIDEDESDED